MDQSNRCRFTDTILPRLVCQPGEVEAFYWDTDLSGFGIRAYETGYRAWMAQCRDVSGRTRRKAFGDVKRVPLKVARVAVRRFLSKVTLGEDPQAEQRASRKAARVLALVDAYLADAKHRLKPRSFLEVERHLRVHAKPLHGDAAMLVGRANVVKLLAAIAKASGPVAANRVRSSLSAMWTWSLQSGLIDGDNPVARVPKPGTEAARERVMSDAELALIWRTTGSDHDHDRIVRLLMLSGARREEVGGLDWTEIEGHLWTLPRARAKNGLPHEVPFGPLALTQLPARRAGRSLVFGEGTGGFSGWSRCKERLDSRMFALLQDDFRAQHGRVPIGDEVTLSAWTLHDLRRTISTWLSETGTEPHIVEAVLNHVSGVAKRGVAGRYNKAQYREQKQSALARWEAHLAALVGLPQFMTGDVFQLTRTTG